MTSFATQARAVGLFYRSVAPFTLGITGLLLGAVLLPLLAEGKASGRLPALVLAKLLTVPAVWYLAERTRPNQYWFYFNLGLSRRWLWAGVAMLDSLLFIGLLLAVNALAA